MELGKLASFEGPDGKVRTAKITERHISALLGFAGNRALPIHWTHGWHKAEADKSPDADRIELEARCGAWKQCRKDSEGNAVADAYLRDDEHRGGILFAAEHNPEDLMASAVFNYDRNDPESIPINFRCADFVPFGAATTALFSEADPTSNTMDINELIQALADPKVQDAVAAIIKSHKKDSDAATATAEEAPAAEMEAAAGVTDADKKDEDKTKSALMSRMDIARLRIYKSITRKIGELATEKTALLNEVKTTARVEATALLGKGGFQIQSGGGGGNEDVYSATLAKFTAIESNPQKAALMMLRKHPELMPAHADATRARISKFSAA